MLKVTDLKFLSRIDFKYYILQVANTSLMQYINFSPSLGLGITYTNKMASEVWRSLSNPGLCKGAIQTAWTGYVH